MQEFILCIILYFIFILYFVPFSSKRGHIYIFDIISDNLRIITSTHICSYRNDETMSIGL